MGKRSSATTVLEVEKRSNQAEFDTYRKKKVKSKEEVDKSVLDAWIDFLEAPSTDMTIGIATIFLVCFELGVAIKKLGVANALEEAVRLNFLNDNMRFSSLKCIILYAFRIGH